MKIKINKETFAQNPCPKITKEMWDWYWYNFSIMLRNHYEGDKKINTIDIRINQAYKGFYKIHFYTSVNGGEEMHQEWNGTYKKYLRFYERYDWHRDLIQNGFDVGFSTSIKRYEARKFRWQQKDKSKYRVKKLVDKWNQYQTLKEYFE